jgi:protein TonB
MTVRPELLNRPEVQQALVRNYPPLLRDAGIGGSPTVHFFIAATGEVQKLMIAQTSGYPALDQAALAVARVMRFSPAMNRDRDVAVWVEIPIIFTAK